MFLDVTEAESQLLETLWKLGPCTPIIFFDEVRRQRSWSDSTVKTLLSRLVRKGLVRSERHEGKTVYVPLIERDQYLDRIVDNLIARAFDGDRRKLLAFLQRASSSRGA